ncbi:hypothetical protein L2D24_18955, partial [Escherichia coli]
MPDALRLSGLHSHQIVGRIRRYAASSKNLVVPYKNPIRGRKMSDTSPAIPESIDPANQHKALTAGQQAV